MKKLSGYIIAITIALVFWSISLYADIPTVQTTPNSNQTAVDDTSDIILTFLQTASTANITPIKSQLGYYYLTLSNVSPYITYSSERPRRLRGLVPVAQFITAWDSGSNSFKDNNPNGVIIAGKTNGQDSTGNPPLLAIFSNPVYDASRNMMQYIVTPLYSQPIFSDAFSLENVTVMIQQ